MKISEAQKDKNRSALINAALELMEEQGIDSTTMIQITKKAKLSPAVIYKYFPTKESILFGFFSDTLDKSIGDLKKIKDLKKYSFTEKVQTFIDLQLEKFIDHREFVSQAHEKLFRSVLGGNAREMLEARKKFAAVIEDFLEEAVEAEEFQEPSMKESVPQMIWDYYLGVVFYWLKDDSRGFTRTTEYMDKTLGIAEVLLKTNIMNRVSDFVYFMFKQHLLPRFDLLNEIPPIKRGLSRIKSRVGAARKKEARHERQK